MASDIVRVRSCVRAKASLDLGSDAWGHTVEVSDKQIARKSEPAESAKHSALRTGGMG